MQIEGQAAVVTGVVRGLAQLRRVRWRSVALELPCWIAMGQVLRMWPLSLQATVWRVTLRMR